MDKDNEKASTIKILKKENGRISVEETTEENIISRHPLVEILDDFVQRIDDIISAASSMIPAAGKIFNNRIDKLNARINEAEKKLKEGTPAEVSHASAELLDISYTSERIARSKLQEVLAKSLFIDIFAEYDYFFGLVLKELYEQREDLLSSLSRQISFAELVKFRDLDAVKNSVLELEIENIRRESYVEQFEILKRKFGITLTAFAEWPKFVEAAQRRNLMVHCGGHVSGQYLDVCEEQKYVFPTRPIINSRLEIPGKYFIDCAELVCRVGVMLTHTLWRKLLPKEKESADDELNNQIYRLLCAKRWGLAAEIGLYALTPTMTQGTKEMTHRIRICNTAIALKKSQRHDEKERLLANFDWSASIRDFRLALAVLSDEHTKAIQIMKEIGKKGELVDEVGYHQ
ncbi:hypothetical protein [Massilia sp.]|uniref:hypothetical protein n=1 Tax=Massilia sp. TaxID=1882437 RepID=UPI00352F4932